MNIIYILIGASLLILGRKYAWIFTAGIVYFITLEIIARVASDLPYVLVIFIGLIFAASGAFISSLTKPLAISLAGFLAASYLFSLVTAAYKWLPGQTWIPYLAGGVVGLVMIAAIADWTMLVFSSLVGALMVTRGLTVHPAWLLVYFLGIALVGMIIQLIIMLVERPRIPAPQPGKAVEEVEPGISGDLKT